MRVITLVRHRIMLVRPCAYTPFFMILPTMADINWIIILVYLAQRWRATCCRNKRRRTRLRTYLKMGNGARADVNSVWVFRQLWRACCLQNASGDECSLSKVASSSFVPSIRLNVATVVLFDDDGSLPCLLTTTKEGRLRGQKMSPTWNGARHDTWGEREPEACMRQAVDIMREFWEHNHQKGSSSAGEPSCVVRFATVPSIAFFIDLHSY